MPSKSSSRSSVYHVYACSKRDRSQILRMVSTLKHCSAVLSKDPALCGSKYRGAASPPNHKNTAARAGCHHQQLCPPSMHLHSNISTFPKLQGHEHNQKLTSDQLSTPKNQPYPGSSPQRWYHPALNVFCPALPQIICSGFEHPSDANYSSPRMNMIVMTACRDALSKHQENTLLIRQRRLCKR